ncbi:MAG: hypothetical protein M3083_15610 [Actinomycetota bacterium]|nr:hypothetical protein [Actinomycetota bacterium]
MTDPHDLLTRTAALEPVATATAAAHAPSLGSHRTAPSACGQGMRLMRISVSSWRTTEADVDRSVAAIGAARERRSQLGDVVQV